MNGYMWTPTHSHIWIPLLPPGSLLPVLLELVHQLDLLHHAMTPLETHPNPHSASTKTRSPFAKAVANLVPNDRAVHGFDQKRPGHGPMPGELWHRSLFFSHVGVHGLMLLPFAMLEVLVQVLRKFWYLRSS